MHIAVLILINYSIVSTRLWISEMLFPTSIVGKIKIQSSVIGIIGAGLLFYFPKILNILQTLIPKVQTLSHISLTHITIESSLLFILFSYCSAIILSALGYNKKKIIIASIIGLITIGLMSILINLSIRITIPTIVLYYLIVATSEEVIKFFSTWSLNSSPFQSDAILIGILAGLGFSFVENLAYALYVSSTLKEQISTLISRGAVGFLMHSIFTGSIAALILYLHKRKSQLLKESGNELGNEITNDVRIGSSETIQGNTQKINQTNKELKVKRTGKNSLPKSNSLLSQLPIVLTGISGGIILHLIYNLGISLNNSLITLIMVSLSYILISYLFFESDSVYMKSISN